MAALAIPVIEAVAARVLAALGAGAVAGIADETLRKRQKEADQAKTKPIARTDAAARSDEKCKECPPDKGFLFERKTAGWSVDSIGYQIRIGQMPPAPPGIIFEWKFRGLEFDGFDSSQCMLKEAKARYDQFFDEWGRFAYPFQEKIFVKMTAEAVSQNAVAIPKPPVKLQWNFMESISYRYMSKLLARATPEIEVLFRP